MELVFSKYVVFGIDRFRVIANFAQKTANVLFFAVCGDTRSLI